MKKCILVFFIAVFSITPKAKSQSFEIQQLLLDVQKLAELKNILNDLYEGYQIVFNGYNSIKDISQGNFSLHKVFLDGLLAVSPSVKKYKRIEDIISLQLKIVSEYKTAYRRFKVSGNFSPSEIEYMGNVYSNLFNKSVQNLDELSMVTTANTLRMSDDERLQSIDRVFNDMQGKLLFLRNFNSRFEFISSQRVSGKNNIKMIEDLYGK